MIAEFGLTLVVALSMPQDLRLSGVQVESGADRAWPNRSITVANARILPPGESPADAAQTRDFKGFGYVLPGLVDAHAHLLGLGQSLEQVDLVGCQSYEELVERVRMRAEGVAEGEWILGRGWDQNDWPGKKLPTHDELSSLLPDHPVVLTRIDGHALLANYAAMQAAGIDETTESPSGGEILQEDGLPTGVFVDRAMELVRVHQPPMTREQIERYLMAAQDECLRLGLTCVHDAGMAPGVLDVLRELHTRGKWGLRVYVMLPANAEDEIRKGPWQTPDRVITVRAVKAYADGALGSRGAALLEPYSDRRGSRGLMLTPVAGLRRTAQLCAEHGFQLCVHAIGDAANRAVLDAFRDAELGASARTARFRIEHAQIVHPDDFVRFRDQHVIPSMQPTHLTSDMPWAPERLGDERIRGAYAWRSFLALGLPVPFGSDFPVEGTDPLLGWYAAATTRSANGADPEWRPDQKLSRREILRGFTQHAAYASFGEHDFGTVEAGKFADFTVYDRDLMTCTADELREARVLMTVIGGRVVYEVHDVNRAPGPMSVARVREVLEFFASDEMAGRDSPSPGLDRAAEYIESAFGTVGLWALGDDGSYYHHYNVPGREFDSTRVRVRVERDGQAPLRLRPNVDVRLWRAGRAIRDGEFDANFEPLRAVRRGRARTPRFFLCPEDSPLWQMAEGRRRSLETFMTGAAPVFLVREGSVEPGAAKVVVDVPAARKVDVELKNVAGYYPGGELPDEFVFVTAHYDHVGVRSASGADLVFNGADDNATGATAVVTLAQWFARSGMKFKRSIAFVAFSAEEKGLLGSKAFVARREFDVSKAHSVVNIEMLGRPEPGRRYYAWITGSDLTEFQAFVAEAFARNSVELIDFELAGPLFTASDNAPFARLGIAAHSISAGYMHDDYHGPDDEVDRIDVGHMTQVLHAVRDAIIDLANSETRPRFTEKGVDWLKQQRRR